MFQPSPDYTEAEVKAIDPGSALSRSALLPVVTGLNYSRVIQFGCPVVLFLGRQDDITPSVIAAEWLNRVQAPGKKLVWFENSAHRAMVEEPGLFLVHRVEDARPYAGPGPVSARP